MVELSSQLILGAGSTLLSTVPTGIILKELPDQKRKEAVKIYILIWITFLIALLSVFVLGLDSSWFLLPFVITIIYFGYCFANIVYRENTPKSRKKYRHRRKYKRWKRR